MLGYRSREEEAPYFSWGIWEGVRKRGGIWNECWRVSREEKGFQMVGESVKPYLEVWNSHMSRSRQVPRRWNKEEVSGRSRNEIGLRTCPIQAVFFLTWHLPHYFVTACLLIWITPHALQNTPFVYFVEHLQSRCSTNIQQSVSWSHVIKGCRTRCC